MGVIFGVVLVYCPICGKRMQYKFSQTWHHKTFGVICSEECMREAELKYARLLTGQDEDDETRTAQH